MKTLLILSLFFAPLFSEVTSDSQDADEPIVVKDKSGLSDDEVREIAKKSEKTDDKKVTIKEVFEATDSSGKVDVSKLRSTWEELTPTAKTYDWVRTTSGEWFKGEIKALYNDNLEFDSSEIGLYTFDFDDVTNIKSYNVMSVNIEGLASFVGIIRLKGSKIKIIQGHNTFEFEKTQVVSFAPASEKERDSWSGKITLNLDKRTGNKNQFDYTTTLNLKRRTDKSRLVLDYLGRVSEVNSIKTANDHRINEKFDIYLSRDFFWTPLFAEYYTDEFQNIDSQYTAGVGLGYTVIDTKKTEWYLSGGPAVVYTTHSTVLETEDRTISSPALELSTNLTVDINSKMDFKYDYKLTLTDENSGRYKHHMVAALENELTSWLDFDITAIWDYLKEPQRDAEGLLPKRDDYQFLLGLGVEF